MNWSGCLYLGWRYLQRHGRKAALLVAAITLSLFLPIGITIAVTAAEKHLRSRSASTPLLLGAPGSPLELVFNGIYFEKPDVAPLTYRHAEEATSDDLARAIPIHAQFAARDYRIVGTSLDYFSFRDLTTASGRLMTRLGDCVLGAGIARTLALGPGDTIVSSPEQVFDLAGVYPLKMRVTGVLKPTGGPDDQAVFTDLKTTWIIAGIAHGHEEAQKGEAGTVLEKDGNNIALNASIYEYTEITDDNVDSFHFHGESADFPITSAILLPHDEKAETILLGRYLDQDSTGAQLVRPDGVMAELFETVFQVRDWVVAALAAVGIAAAIIAGLVFLLSNRLRAREFESLANIGADRNSMRLLLAFEAGFVIVTSVLLAILLVIVLRALLPVFLFQ